jgi:hypothetical protein
LINGRNGGYIDVLLGTVIDVSLIVDMIMSHVEIIMSCSYIKIVMSYIEGVMSYFENIMSYVEIVISECPTLRA